MFYRRRFLAPSVLRAFVFVAALFGSVGTNAGQTMENKRGAIEVGKLTGFPLRVLSESLDSDQGIILAQSKKQLGQGIAQNSLRVNQLEEQVRSLTGQIEKLVFEIETLRKQMQLMQEDFEFRFQDLEGGVDQSNLDDEVTSPVSEPEVRTAETQNGIATPPVNPAPQVAATAQSQPLDLGAAARRTNEQPVVPQSVEPLPQQGLQSRDPLLQPNGVASLGTLTVNPGEDAEALYNLGYSQLLNGEVELSEINLRRFLEIYPQHTLTPSAQYWLGETYFVRGLYDSAVAEFSAGIRTFPESQKAPDTLLKLGLSLARLNETDAACATLKEVFFRFPDAPRSIKIAAREEQVRSNCS